MKTRLFSFFFLIVTLGTFGTLALSQSTPQFISLQGFLSDKSGGTPVPASGTFNMTFTLWSGDSGDPSATLIANDGSSPQVVTVVDGVYEAKLQFSAGDFSSIPRYVEITVQSGTAPAETLVPRTHIISSAFALVADKLDGFEGADLDQSSDVTSIEGDVSIIQGQVTTVALDLGAHETATDPHAAYFKKAGDIVTGTLSLNPGSGDALLSMTGNVGLRTSSPQGVLHVNTDLTTNENIILSRDGSATAYQMRLSNNGSRDALLISNDCCDSLGIAIQDNGQLGVGTLVPLSALDVRSETVGSSNFKGIHYGYNNSEGGAWISSTADSVAMFSGGSYYANSGLWRAKASAAAAVSFNGGDILFYADSGLSPDTNFAPTEVMRVKEDGTTQVKVLQILGNGADLAEPFPIAEGVQPPDGSIVVIDDENPGQLKLSDRPYDRRVAGIVSGAGGLHPGVTLGQTDKLGNGPLVAMAGRVYCQATASNGAIHPGDMLTTSEIPGYAMKATSKRKRHGAVIGKAMTGLDEGEGLVLVLANLH